MKPTFGKLIRGEVPVLVDFSATWCQPCKMMEPILKELAGRMKGEITIVKIDVDDNPQVSSAYQISGVPTLILFHNGEVLWRQSGVQSASALEQIIRQHLPVTKEEELQDNQASVS